MSVRRVGTQPRTSHTAQMRLGEHEHRARHASQRDGSAGSSSSSSTPSSRYSDIAAPAGSRSPRGVHSESRGRQRHVAQDLVHTSRTNGAAAEAPVSAAAGSVNAPSLSTESTTNSLLHRLPRIRGRTAVAACADTQLLDARGGPRHTVVDSIRSL